MAAAGAGAPDVGADTQPRQPAPAGRGAGGVAVVPGGPGATEAAAAVGDRDGATDVAGVETPPGPPLPAGRGGGGGRAAHEGGGVGGGRGRSA